MYKRQVEAGAEVVHGCINGLGERCGNAAIEEIIVAAEALYGIDTGINTKLLKETCLMVEKIWSKVIFQQTDSRYSSLYERKWYGDTNGK